MRTLSLNCVAHANAIDNPTHSMGLPRDSSNMAGGWSFVAIMSGTRHNQVGEYMLASMVDPS